MFSTGSESSRGALPVPRALLWAGGIVLAVAGVLFYFVVDPVQWSVFPPCLFHQLTGLDCPGCGTQRAFHQLLHGNLIAAIRLNAMFVVSLPLFAWLGIRYVVRQWRGQPANFRFKWLWFYLVVWLVFAVLRDLPVPLFAWFAAP